QTSIRRKYMGDSFVSSHIATIGVDFAKKVIEHEGSKGWLIIWDLAGQPTYESVRRHYYLGCHSIILVYSVVDRNSFDNSSKWLVEAHKYMGKLPPTAVLANKIDLRSSREKDEIVTSEEGEKFTRIICDRLGVPAVFKETSALTGENIEDAFHELVEMMIKLNPL
ncbi:MAG: GTP-binding protein, partial [Candidatus Thorarchaeota archaeon]